MCHLVYLGFIVISAGLAVLLFSFLFSLISPFHSSLIFHYSETVADDSQFTEAKTTCSATFLRVEILQTVGGKRLTKYLALLNARRQHAGFLKKSLHNLPATSIYHLLVCFLLDFAVAPFATLLGRR